MSDASDRLRRNRALILERSFAAGLVGLVPIPALDELLEGAVRRTLLVRIAAVRNVGLDDAAADTLAQPLRTDAMGAVARATSGLSLLRRRLRRFAAVLRVAERGGEVVSTFALATLFDHYCATHHVGPGVDPALALRLRRAIEAAIADASRGVARRSARGAFTTVRRAITAAPRALLGSATPDPAAPAEAEPVAPGSTALALPPRGRFARGALAVGGAVGSFGAGWIEALLAAFDARWAATEGAGATS